MMIFLAPVDRPGNDVFIILGVYVILLAIVRIYEIPKSLFQRVRKRFV